MFKAIIPAMITAAMVVPLSAQAHLGHPAWDDHVEYKKRQLKEYRKYKKQQRKKIRAAWREHLRDSHDYYHASYERARDYYELPYSVRVKLARQKRTPVGWYKRADGRYCLTRRAYRKAPVLKRKGDGVVQVRVNNDVLTVVEATRQILDVMRR